MTPSPRPLKIIHVLRAPMGGVLRHVRDLAAEQAALGHVVGLICDVPGTPGYNEAMLAALRDNLELGLHRIAIGRSVGLSDVTSVRSAMAILGKAGADVVHGHGAKGGVIARIAGRFGTRNHRPVRFYSPHGGSLHYDPASLNGRLYFAIERMLERMTDGILFVADYEKRTYAAKIGAPTCPFRVVHNGLRAAEFDPVQPDQDTADFLLIGEMRMLKGPDFFVEGVRRLAAAGHPVSAVMVGDGPDRTAVETLIADAGLGAQIALRPPMKAREAFALARTVVMPSRAEAMPYIVLEALAAGCRLIATDVGGIGEIFGDKADALVSPDADSIASAMADAFRNPDALSETMPDLEALRSGFSVEAMAAGVMGAYGAALAKRHGLQPPVEANVS